MEWSHKYGSERACERVRISVYVRGVHVCAVSHVWVWCACLCGCLRVCMCLHVGVCDLCIPVHVHTCTRVYVCVNVCGQALWALPLKLSSLFLTDPHMLSRYVCGAPPRRMGGACSPTAVTPPLSTACGTEQRG